MRQCSSSKGKLKFAFYPLNIVKDMPVVPTYYAVNSTEVVYYNIKGQES